MPRPSTLNLHGRQPSAPTLSLIPRPSTLSSGDQEGLVREGGARFRGGFVLRAHRLVYHSILGLRVIKSLASNKEEEAEERAGPRETKPRHLDERLNPPLKNLEERLKPETRNHRNTASKRRCAPGKLVS